MNSVSRDIFRAIYEGKWLSIEYKNKDERITKYWIGIKNVNPVEKILIVDGLHLGYMTVRELNRVFVDSIISSSVVEGSYYEINKKLVDDIYLNPHKYVNLFENTANLQILNYLELCNKNDTTPYYSEFELVKYLDRDTIKNNKYMLTDEQFKYIVNNFQYKSVNKIKKTRIQKLAMNVLSIHTDKGLYVLAYKELELDIKNRMLIASDEISICYEFNIDEYRQSIRRFLDADDFALLNDFERNQEIIKDKINKSIKNSYNMVDDMPYIIGLGMDVAIDLHNEYKKILDMYKDEKVTVPIKAFFGDMLSRQKARNPYPIVILNNNINMDQLLAINSAMKYPVTYIQGPPGTGKTNTIINTIITAFFNEKTVLFSSYNNHPINGVFDKLTTLKYNEKNIPFPILRIGNIDVMKDSLVYVRNLYEISKKITVYEKTLDKNKDDRKVRAKNLSDLLKKYDEVLDLKERKETIDRLIEYGVNKKNNIQMLPFNTDLQGRQLNSINKRIKNVGDISEEQALRLIDNDYGELMKYLYFTSAGYIKKLNSSKYDDFRGILECENEEIAIKNFISYFKENENIKKIQKIFPIIVATCISSHKLGDGDPVFDITIMDEAGQCNVAVSLVPIVRGKNLMLVGAPQQLKPVILLNEMVNERLKNKYLITDEYDYIKNSIYTTYLSCDSLSDEILLHNHYRCNKKIIDFNNKKYYNSKLKIKSNNNEINPLQFVDITDATTNYKNTSPVEVNHIVKYVANNRDKSIGIITPFVNQKKLIDAELERMKINNVTCGTIHAFQGDEKDIILFSTAITDKTYLGTYNWLKNNKELINVATSRAKNKLIVLGSKKNLERLHNSNESDDLYELIEYVQTNGNSIVTPKSSSSRALGVKPFSSRTEAAFLENLSYALENIWLTQSKYVVHKEVAISHVFADNIDYNSLFYSGRFDFVVYEKMGDTEIPILAIELDGKEHIDNEIVKNRDRLKEKICAKHNLQIIRVENSYARRYNYIKEILINYFKIMH